MTDTIQSSDKSKQTSAWLRGLISIAWADGNLAPEEQALISTLAHQELSAEDPAENSAEAYQPISGSEIAEALGADSHVAENFLRTAVMVALADGNYSQSEDDLLNEYCQALGLETEVLAVLRSSLTDLIAQADAQSSQSSIASDLHPHAQVDLLHPVRDWLEQMEVHDPKVAHFLCKMIPSQCPFERDINVFGRNIVHIPALCKLNPLYEQLVSLRFRALSYLADDCREDISDYC